MASKSAKGAAKQQQQAADQAAALNTSAWQQQQALQQPYLQAGRSAITNLGALMTPGQPYTPQMQAANAQSGAGMPGPWNGTAMPAPSSGRPMSVFGSGAAQQQQGMPGLMASRPSGPSGSSAPAQAFASAFGGGGDTVLIESPDGSERRPVPRQMAQQYLSRGGRIVG